MSPDGRILVGEPNGVKGLIVASACLVGGIERSPGMGRLASEIVTGRTPFVPLEALHVDRFGDAYANDAALRAACEELYSRHYHAVY
jgi:glycine/D-amino acid oxidase-like deaminating enzyme